VINEGNYDVVHVHLFPALYVAGLAKLFHLTRTKLIFTEHSTFNRRMTNPFYRCIDRLVYNQYSHVVAISDKVKANMVRQLNKSNIDTVYNGIDLNAIRDTAPLNIRQELALPEDAYILTMVGRFIASKDYTTLFQSLNYLPENVHVVCVGKGELMDEYKQKIQSERWASKVHFLGLRTDVINILKGSDIIVLSTEYEGFSISMLEGMSCMKPFVASAVPGVADLVDGVAELFEYRNAGQLAEIVKHLMNDRNAYQKIAERCYQFAAQHNIDRVAAKYFSIYNS
jgi:glycosyltransferase involved in cell wall biosynthesis